MIWSGSSRSGATPEMGRRRPRKQTQRAQKIIAVALIITMGASGLAFYAAANAGQQAPSTHQGR